MGDKSPDGSGRPPQSGGTPLTPTVTDIDGSSRQAPSDGSSNSALQKSNWRIRAAERDMHQRPGENEVAYQIRIFDARRAERQQLKAANG